MEKTVVIQTGDIIIKMLMKNTPLAEKIYNTLPLTARTRIWGKEIYFEIPVTSKLENAVNEVNKGDVAYWNEGRCLCLFFGPTPISKGEKPIPASTVEVVGEMVSDYAKLETISSEETITIKKEP